MPLTSVTSDPAALTLTVIGDYPVPVERLWQAWADPRQLERFWGPPTWPATFSRHDLTPGARSDYHMTGPDGERAAGYWLIETVDEPRSFSFIDGFAHPDGAPNDDLPKTATTLHFEPTPTGSRFTATSTFPDLASMQQLLEMGMQEGLAEALAELDALIEG